MLAEDAPRTAPERLFDCASLAVAENSNGLAACATDFQPGPFGFVRILVIDRGMDAEQTGALVQRVIEVETYRTLGAARRATPRAVDRCLQAATG